MARRAKRSPEREPINWADIIELVVGVVFLIGGAALILTRT